jgi:hypothetical protein
LEISCQYGCILMIHGFHGVSNFKFYVGWVGMQERRMALLLPSTIIYLLKCERKYFQRDKDVELSRLRTRVIYRHLAYFSPKNCLLIRVEYDLNQFLTQIPFVGSLDHFLELG